MKPLQRLVGAAMLAALAAIVLFLPRNVPFAGMRYPFVFGNSLALQLSVDMRQLAIEVGAVVLIGGAVYLFLGRMR